MTTSDRLFHVRCWTQTTGDRSRFELPICFMSQRPCPEHWVRGGRDTSRSLYPYAFKHCESASGQYPSAGSSPISGECLWPTIHMKVPRVMLVMPGMTAPAASRAPAPSVPARHARHGVERVPKPPVRAKTVWSLVLRRLYNELVQQQRSQYRYRKSRGHYRACPVAVRNRKRSAGLENGE